MAHRAHLRLLLALVVSFAALFALYGAESARADSLASTSVARNAKHVLNAKHASNAAQCRAHGVDSRMIENSPPDDGNLGAAVGQWNDNNDPDDILQTESISIAYPLLTSGFGRRVGHAVSRERLFSAAFPRGPPAL